MFRLIISVNLSLLLLNCAPVKGVYHTVRKGESIARISQAYSVDEVYIARLNGINDPDELRAGQRILIPGATESRRVTESIRHDKKISPSVEKKQDNIDRKVSVIHKPAVGKFDWPVQGKVVKDFGGVEGNAGKGIEISVPVNTPVWASAAGQVIYSGNGIAGFGNLIIIKHDDSFFTVYGYNRKNLVEAGSFVGKKEKVALSGSPPGKEEALLYFEIRSGKTVVNPFLYLP